MRAHVVFASSLALCLASCVSLAADADQRGLRVTVRDGTSAGSIPLYSRMIAVIIGIDQYQNLGADQQLKQAVKDAQGVEQVLRELYPFDPIITLYNEQATKNAILKALQGDLVNTSPDDGVLIYFAGHGVTHPTRQGDLGFLVPYDGSLKSDEQYRNISMQQIKSDIAPMIPAKHVLIIADACFGGLLLNTRSASMDPVHKAAYLKAVTGEQVRQIITAGGKGETVLDGGAGGHSVFTGRLIAALRNVDDFMTAKELGMLIQQQVFGDAAARSHPQRPQVGEIYGTGDFVFAPDAARRQAHQASEIQKLQAELADLEKRKKEAEAGRDEVKQREIERERLLKEGALKQAKLREEAAKAEAEAQARAEEAARRDAAEMARRNKENDERLAMLKQQAEKLRSEVGQENSAALTMGAAMVELRRIDAALAKLQADCEKETIDLTAANEAAYPPRIAEAEKVAPRVAMFETEAEYQARVRGSVKRVAALRQEMGERITGVKTQLTAELTRQTQPLQLQKQNILGQRFTLGARHMSFLFVNYDLERELFDVDMSRGKMAVSRGPGTPLVEGKPFTVMVGSVSEWAGTVQVPRTKAREYYQHPDLLVPEVVLGFTALTNAALLSFALQAPDDTRYQASMHVQPAPLKMEMVWIPPGKFMMGSRANEAGRDSGEGPRHRVTISKGFWMGKYEVTQEQWQRVMDSNPSNFRGAQNPVEKVSWNDCQAFIEKLTMMAANRGFRLPTEAEWEYACRAESVTRFNTGDDDSVLDRAGWHGGNSGNTTHPVGQKAPNSWGLYDMHGNVWEWCQDWKGDYSADSVTDPEGSSEGSDRVLRGGSWYGAPRYCRSAIRDGDGPTVASIHVGFRVVLR